MSIVDAMPHLSVLNYELEIAVKKSLQRVLSVILIFDTVLTLKKSDIFLGEEKVI